MKIGPVLVRNTFPLNLIPANSLFSIFLLFIFTLSVAMKAYFRGLAAACKSPASAQTLAGISILAMALYTGE